MTARMQHLAAEIVRLQGELDREIEQRRKALGWELKEQIGEFEHGVAVEHRRLRRSLAGFVGVTSPATVLSTPVIYSLIVPLALADVWVSAYQAICFRAYGIAQVKRADYFAFDRRKLSYLNLVEMANCQFCAYATGVIAYVREIASRTEQYWCPIKHAVKVADPHLRYYQFLEYGDAEGYRARLKDFRAKLRTEPEASAPADV
jgi:hypothetical protein